MRTSVSKDFGTLSVNVVLCARILKMCVCARLAELRRSEILRIWRRTCASRLFEKTFCSATFRIACLRKQHGVYGNDLRGYIGFVRFKTGMVLADFTFVVIRQSTSS